MQQWIELIRDKEMPIFGQTVQSILNVTSDDDAPAAKLAGVVLQDASMTSRVLKLANSVHFNPQRVAMSTISRAVIVLGFNIVRNMCLSISLVDAFVSGGARERLIQTLSRAIHAAVQAEAIARVRNDPRPEEIFIATLLYHIGDMAFWCFSGEVGERLEQTEKLPGYDERQAQEEVLGFQLRQLGSGLAREWHLPPLLQEAIKHPEQMGARGTNITMAHQLAAAAEEHGWDAPETEEQIAQLARFSGKDPAELTKVLHQNAREAEEIARYYGAARAAQAIPLPGAPGRKEREAPVKEEPVFEHPQPDGMLQLRILRELSTILENGCDLNMVMEMVMEGIYRGVGMDRVLFALLTPDRKGLNARFGLGHENLELTRLFHFTRIVNERNIFFETIDKRLNLWIDCDQRKELLALVNNRVTGVIGKRPFYVATIEINGRGIGLLYADRALSGRSLDEESFESFRHFVKQANMSLGVIAGRRH